ncbi:YcaO-like family protein [Microseira sp. BLCC-F43]|uniref:YcaO-like family protein n=1 Tax=Microseira sp. BLCC-F43 TaxID=3153602 RepID=UPI0035B7B28B
MKPKSLSAWVGKGSPIRELVKLQRRPTDFRFHVWGTRISQDLEARLPETADRFVGCGISEDNENAIASACGEALERYVFALTEDLLAELPVQNPDNSISADLIFNLPFLLPKTISRKAWCEQAINSPRRILPAWKLDTNSPNYLLPVEFLTQNQSINLFQTTNGMACGITLEDAIDRGLREVIERDALMVVWLYKNGGTFINPANILPDNYLEQVQRMQNRGIKTIIRDISPEFGYKVILAIIGYFPAEGSPIFAFGAGAAVNIDDAARHAFREACLGWKGVSWRVGLSGLRQDFSEGKEAIPGSFAQHSELYFDPEMVSQVSFLFENKPAPLAEADPLVYRSQVEPGNELIGNYQLPKDIFVLDLTTPDVREMGAYVVKVIVPGLVPFYFADLGTDELAATRLPTTIGGINIDKDATINTMPHPWP